MRRTGLLVWLAPVVACAACGGGGGAGSAGWAGLSRYDAENSAFDAIHQEEGDSTSPAFRQALLFAAAEHGHRPDGAQAWVAYFKTTEGKRSPLCVMIWSETKAAFQERYGYTLARCPGGV